MDSVANIFAILFLSVVFLAIGFISIIIKHDMKPKTIKIITYKGKYYNGIMLDESACTRCAFHNRHLNKRQDCDAVFAEHKCSDGNKYIIWRYNKVLNKGR